MCNFSSSFLVGENFLLPGQSCIPCVAPPGGISPQYLIRSRVGHHSYKTQCFPVLPMQCLLGLTLAGPTCDYRALSQEAKVQDLGRGVVRPSHKPGPSPIRLTEADCLGLTLPCRIARSDSRFMPNNITSLGQPRRPHPPPPESAPSSFGTYL